jgi:hypothetical protein
MNMRVFLICLIGAVGLVIANFGPPAAAQSLKSVVRHPKCDRQSRGCVAARRSGAALWAAD